ncbi:MAG: hypothetical protein HQL15_08565 [Candidatus Omnitrophica bacterium]|nr:hypothetical protein [Candidatus Omnitrophota bacterium]
MLKKRIKVMMNAGLVLLISASEVWAQSVGSGSSTSTTGDPLDVSNEFSTKMLDIVKGPILKVLAAAVLLVGIAGLLRGRHKLAESCGMAFLLILCLPVLLGKI